MNERERRARGNITSQLLRLNGIDVEKKNNGGTLQATTSSSCQTNPLQVGKRTGRVTASLTLARGTTKEECLFLK